MTPQKKQDGEWRRQGDDHFKAADEALARHDAPGTPGVHALLAIYCELRHMSGDGEQAEAMRRLAHALVLHSST